MSKIICYGAILWDIYPDNRFIGGAPFNLCGHLSKLGNETYMITGVGEDELGQSAREQIEKIDVKSDYVYIDPNHPTGTAQVTLDEKGVPTYYLPDGVAYQYIELTDKQLASIKAGAFDMICFGTLEMKGSKSCETIHQLLELCSFGEVFVDINIRLDFHPIEIIQYAISQATILKLNKNETILISGLLYNNRNEEECIRSLFAEYQKLHCICVTKGPLGCTTFTRTQHIDMNECRSDAVDTVGAGDAFSAGFINSYLATRDYYISTKRASILSDFVASKHGAIPDYDNLLQMRFDQL